MNRLWVHLAIGFAAAALITALTVGGLASTQMQSQFHHFMLDNQPSSAILVRQLTDYYAQHQTWEGVEVVLESTGGGHMAAMHGGPILADNAGRILYGQSPNDQNRQLTTPERASSTPIHWQGSVVGYVVTSGVAMMNDMDAMLQPSAQQFLLQISQTLLYAGLIGALLGGLLGVVIARRLAAPLGRLSSAAREIAGGDLSHRLTPVGTHEIAGVATSFNAMAESLQRSAEQQQRLVADIAHELRTPLSVLQGNLQAMLDGVYPLTPNEIAILYDETLMLARLVEDLRGLAQADAGQLSIEHQNIDPQILVADVADVFSGLAEERGITLHTQINPDIPRFAADPDRLRQVLHNLLANALHHTANGGAVWITATSAANTFRLEVRDTGTGISATDLPHVFERFWRADPARSRGQGGTGLGLAIAHHIIIAHGGQIGAESTPNQGSTFWFTLPLSPKSASNTASN